jgi:hypothetical protein
MVFLVKEFALTPGERTAAKTAVVLPRRVFGINAGVFTIRAVVD